MKVLILDHHFGQDISALLAADNGRHRIRTLAPLYFADQAARCFPPSVFGADLSEYHRSDLQGARERYRRIAPELLFAIYKVFAFDVFVSPSDTFFYMRDVIDACHELGVPFIVVQKELGVSTKAMEEHAQIMRKWFPFRGDWMTTCSEKSREFWVACGANDEQVSVVGQPRFDLYGQPERWIPLRDMGIQLAPHLPVILFLSYDLDAYNEERARGRVNRPWERLHLETEQALMSLADSGRYSVLIKPHPQHDAATLAALRNRLGDSANVHLLPGGLDTRQLIVGSDVIVGFQTTALAEAMAVGKTVIYTFWTEPVLQACRSLLPFHELGEAITVARSPAELRRGVLVPCTPDPTALVTRRQFFESYLGPVDGQAARRVWEVIDSVVCNWPAPASSTLRLRARLQADLPRLCVREIRRSRRRLLVRRGLLAAARAGGGSPGSRIIEQLSLLCRHEEDRIAECREAVTGQHRTSGRLAGRSDENLAGRSLRYLIRRLFVRPGRFS